MSLLTVLIPRRIAPTPADEERVDSERVDALLWFADYVVKRARFSVWTSNLAVERAEAHLRRVRS